MEATRSARTRHLPDSQDSRSLLRGRVLHFGRALRADEQRPLVGASIRAGTETYYTDDDGTYDIPLDGHELPIHLTISAPGFLDRVETVDWTPILPGGLLMRDFFLLESSFMVGTGTTEELDVLTDPDAPTVETHIPETPRLNLDLDTEALLAMVQPSRPLRPPIPMEPRPSTRAQSRRERGDPSLEASPIVHDPTTIGGLSADTPYLRAEALGIPRLEVALAQPGVLDSLLDKLSEQEEQILVSGAPWSTHFGTNSPFESPPVPQHQPIDADDAFHDSFGAEQDAFAEGQDDGWEEGADADADADDSLQQARAARHNPLPVRGPEDFEAGFDDDDFDAGWAQGSDDPDAAGFDDGGFDDGGFDDEGSDDDGFGDDSSDDHGFGDGSSDDDGFRDDSSDDDGFGDDGFGDDRADDGGFPAEDAEEEQVLVRAPVPPLRAAATAGEVVLKSNANDAWEFFATEAIPAVPRPSAPASSPHQVAVRVQRSERFTGPTNSGSAPSRHAPSPATASVPAPPEEEDDFAWAQPEDDGEGDGWQAEDIGDDEDAW